jgi:hypothetical protein
MLDKAQVAVREVLRKAGLIGGVGRIYRALLPESVRKKLRTSESDLKYGD